MSLKYQTEEPPTTETTGESENYQRAPIITPYYTIALIACLVAVALAQFAVDGGGWLNNGGEKSTLLAGFVKPYFLHGEYWRILTGAALHAGIIHLGFNSYALFSFGKLIETLSNRAHLVIVFLLAAIGGGILSLIFLPDGISVGASGGIVGFLGYMTIYAYKRQKLLPQGFLQNMLVNIGIIAIYGIFLMSHVDNWGHLGGLLVGLIYGFVQIPSDLYKDPREAGNITQLFGYAALSIFIVTAIFSIVLILGIVKIPFPFRYV